MTARAIERIRMPEPHVFMRDYVLKRKPVIITDLFSGEPIRNVASLESAKDLFADVRLRIKPEYTGPTSQHAQTLTFREYWELVQADPSTSLMCTEYEIPARVMTMFTIPDACLIQKDHAAGEILELPKKYGDHDLLSNVFIGNRGNKAHLHYDGDQRHVLLYQVFGSKEIVLVEPRMGMHLKPLHSLTFSGVFLECMTPDEKLSFVESVDGRYDTLQPGEAVYIPMLMWHYLGYNGHAMSFNVRFGRNRVGRFLSVDNFHRDYFVQNVAALFADGDAGGAPLESLLATIVEQFSSPLQPIEKARNFRGLFRSWFAELCPEIDANSFCPAEQEDGELRKIYAFVENTMRYADPQLIAKTRPVGPIGPAQLRYILDVSAQNGYSQDTLRRLLANRVGKDDLEQLSKAEAAQFIFYLHAPGSHLS